jgi:hypothetical protein
MEWADGIGAAHKRQGLAPQGLQRNVCSDCKSLVIRSKQAHVGRAAKFFENHHTPPLCRAQNEVSAVAICTEQAHQAIGQ